MSLKSILDKKKQLNGIEITQEEGKKLLEDLPNLIQNWFVEILRSYPLVDTTFVLNKKKDESKIGVEMNWLAPIDIIEEALLFYPGILVHKQGYLPIGSCLFGSGDYYYLKMKDCNLLDPEFVRIPHDYATEKIYPEDKIELVCSSISEFIEKAKVV